MLCACHSIGYLGSFRFLNVNVILLHSLGFAFICLSCSHFLIFVVCSCSNVTAVSGLVCLTSTTVSSTNVSIVLLVCWPCIVRIILVLFGNIGQDASLLIPVLMSFTSEYTSFIFTTKILLLRYDLSK